MYDVSQHKRNVPTGKGLLDPDGLFGFLLQEVNEGYKTEVVGGHF
jgi:hypothetical protein